MPVVLRLALREIRNHPRFSAFFALNLALGFVGFVVLDGFESSVSRELRARSKAYLTADLAVSSDRALTAAEADRLDALAGSGAQVSRAVELFSMAGAGERARLVMLHAVDPVFPLYGDVVLEGSGAAGVEAKRALREGPGAWIDPPLLAQLGVAPGADVRIGAARFRVQGVVARDGGRVASGFSIAPRIYIARENLEATGLVATGSRVRYRRFYRLPERADVEAAGRALSAAIDDPRVRVRTHVQATRDLARTYEAVGEHLGLVSLVAVFLAGLGAAHLFHAFLTRRVKDVAILVSLGATRARAQLVFLTQLLLLALAGAVLACTLAALLLPLATRLLGGFLPEGFEAGVGWQAAAAVALLALAGSTAACLPLLARLRTLRPAELFAEHARPALGRGPRDALLLLPALALFWAMAVWRAGDLVFGCWFAGIFVGSLLLLLLGALAALRALGRIPARRSIAPRLALRELARGRASTVSAFVAISLCAHLLSLPPQVRGLLERDLVAPEASQLPSLFLFDIQPAQVEPLERFVRERGTELQRVSPLVRARLDSINGAPASERAADGESGADDARARELRSRRYNLTYSGVLNDSERLRAGRPFAGRFGPGARGPAELSLEIDFARRLGVDLGDTLAFDVQGVPVEGRVVALREVRWNSFQPNFFVTFQPGVLEDAPAVFLASVPSLPSREREALQASIAGTFPNVSAIDVTRTVERILDIARQLRWALGSTALLSLLVGLVLVYAIARDQARARRWETNLLKVLGADFLRIRRALDLEFGVLGLVAAVAGSGVSLIALAILARFVFRVPFGVAWVPLVLTLVAVPVVCVVTARLAARRVLRERPLVLLQGHD
jgi:putative ABC transport system permease protein